MYFIPYYWLGVTAVFVHNTATLHFRRILTTGGRVAIAVGSAMFAALLVAAFSVGLYPVELPPQYVGPTQPEAEKIVGLAG